MGSPAEASAQADALTGLLLDEMYPPVLAQRLRQAGHDVVAGRRFPRTAAGINRIEKALDVMLSSNQLPARDNVVWLS